MLKLPRRPGLRFSLRTMFVVVTLFCMWVAWQLNWIRDRHLALKTVHPGGYSLKDYRPAPWSIRLFERGVPFINVDPEIARDTERVNELKRLFPESRLFTPLDGQPVLDRSHNNGCALQEL
jgi:hypothetical protein